MLFPPIVPHFSVPSTKKFATHALPLIVGLGLFATILGFYGGAQAGPLTLFDYASNHSLLLLACLLGGGVAGLFTATGRRSTQDRRLLGPTKPQRSSRAAAGGRKAKEANECPAEVYALAQGVPRDRRAAMARVLRSMTNSSWRRLPGSIAGPHWKRCCGPWKAPRLPLPPA